MPLKCLCQRPGFSGKARQYRFGVRLSLGTASINWVSGTHPHSTGRHAFGYRLTPSLAPVPLHSRPKSLWRRILNISGRNLPHGLGPEPMGDFRLSVLTVETETGRM